MTNTKPVISRRAFIRAVLAQLSAVIVCRKLQCANAADAPPAASGVSVSYGAGAYGEGVYPGDQGFSSEVRQEVE